MLKSERDCHSPHNPGGGLCRCKCDFCRNLRLIMNPRPVDEINQELNEAETVEPDSGCCDGSQCCKCEPEDLSSDDSPVWGPDAWPVNDDPPTGTAVGLDDVSDDTDDAQPDPNGWIDASDADLQAIAEIWREVTGGPDESLRGRLARWWRGVRGRQDVQDCAREAFSGLADMSVELETEEPQETTEGVETIIDGDGGIVAAVVVRRGGGLQSVVITAANGNDDDRPVSVTLDVDGVMGLVAVLVDAMR